MENDVDGGVADEIETAVIYEHRMEEFDIVRFFLFLFFFCVERWRKVIYECQRCERRS